MGNAQEGMAETPMPYIPLNRTMTEDPQNVLGYGVGAPYSPPLRYPKTLNAAMERDMYL